MKNKEFKLLVENWRSNFISESYDEDDDNLNNNLRRFDSGNFDDKNLNPVYQDYMRDSEEDRNLNQEDYEKLKQEKTEELCRLLGIEVNELDPGLND